MAKTTHLQKTLPLDSSIAKATTNVEITSKSLGSEIETFCKVIKPDFTKKVTSALFLQQLKIDIKLSLNVNFVYFQIAPACRTYCTRLKELAIER